MRCRKCNKKAAINMRQHKLALCEEHYPAWIVDQTERLIEKYRMFSPHDKILVAVSGGKDSLSLWDILWQLGYHADGLYIGLGIDGEINYSDESRRLCELFAKERSLDLSIVNVYEEHGATIPQLATHTTRGKDKPCAVCGLTKRHIMNRVAKEGSYDVLLTGHNLDDEAAMLFGNTINWSIDYLVRQSPILEAKNGLVRKTKPLCRFSEREMAAYALIRGIDYIYDECPFSAGSKSIYYKEILNRLEGERPGAKLNFYLSFLRAKESGLFEASTENNTEVSKYGAGGGSLLTCPNCGGPTTVIGECAFCKMIVNIAP